MGEQYLEDFAVGQTFGSGRLRIEKEQALAFAAEFDPQPFDLDGLAESSALASTRAADPGRCAGATNCTSSAR
jgi:acyl dehydratase